MADGRHYQRGAVGYVRLAFERAPMIEALRGCVREMERWGADEDGIPEDAWPAYIAAREIMDATVKDAAR